MAVRILSVMMKFPLLFPVSRPEVLKSNARHGGFRRPTAHETASGAALAAPVRADYAAP